MNRRQLLFSFSTVGIVGTTGCVGATECEETSNHLFVENHVAEQQEIEVRVLKESTDVFTDREWVGVLSETIAVPGETLRTIENVFDGYGDYRTEVEHDGRLEQNHSEIDSCENQVVTIGIGDGIISVINGRPERSTSEDEFES